MSESKPSVPPDSADDAPDLSAPEWREAFARAEVRRGRPKSTEPNGHDDNTRRTPNKERA